MSLSDLALSVTVCPRCDRGPGLRCVTRTGLRATYLHTARTRPLYEAWRDGYGEALAQQASYARTLLERGRDAATIIERLEAQAR